MMAHVQSLGFQVHHYLDDWLLRNQQLAHLRTQTQGLLHLTTSQPGEVRVSSNSRLCLYRHTLSNQSGADVPSSCSVPRSSQSFSSVPPGEVCDGSGLSFTSRKAGVNVSSGALRSSQISASSSLSVSSLATQSGSASRPDSVGSSLLGPNSEMVDQAVQCSSEETHSGSSPSVGHIHRCLHQLLGGPLQQSVSSRAVVSNWNISTHKRVGDVSHSEGCLALPPPDQGQGGDDPLGQQLSSCLPTESGGHSLTAHVSSNMANPSGVPAAGYHPVSEAHPRLSQCFSRQPVEKASNHRHRMVSAPQHSTPDVLHLVTCNVERFFYSCLLTFDWFHLVCLPCNEEVESTFGVRVKSL